MLFVFILGFWLHQFLQLPHPPRKGGMLPMPSCATLILQPVILSLIVSLSLLVGVTPPRVSLIGGSFGSPHLQCVFVLTEVGTTQKPVSRSQSLQWQKPSHHIFQVSSLLQTSGLFTEGTGAGNSSWDGTPSRPCCQSLGKWQERGIPSSGNLPDSLSQMVWIQTV